LNKALEHSEHAEHAAHGSTQAALLVAVLAAGLALCEQQAKHAEIRVQASSIGAADTWSQYQAKSIRGTLARDLADVTAALSAGANPDAQAKAGALAERLRKDVDHYEHGDDGKDAIAKHAHAQEAERDHAIEQTHTFDNAAASLELGIVLATASAVTRTRKLLLLAAVVGLLGAVIGVLGVIAPEMVAI
jgi:hypothetical protein